MTFVEKNLDHVALDYNDDWQINEDGTCDVMITGLEEFVYGFFGATESEVAEDGGWIDTYAVIDPKTDSIIEIIFHATNVTEEEYRELDLKITNEAEGKMLLNKIRDNGGEFDNFYAECKEEVA